MYDEDDERMNIVGQNGNDGIHYDIKEEELFDELFDRPDSKKYDSEVVKEEKYVEEGYNEKEDNWRQEQKELESILKRRLSKFEIDKLKKSKLNIMNSKKDDNDDLIIKYT